MNASPQDFIAKAEENIKAVRVLIKEGLYAIAMSRIYYAMFYLAEAVLLAEGKTYSSHAAVRSALGRDFVKRGRFPKHLHQYLSKAEDLRIISDYSFPGGYSKEQADEQLHRAEEFYDWVCHSLVGKEK